MIRWIVCVIDWPNKFGSARINDLLYGQGSFFSCGTELGNPGLMGYSQSEQRIHFILPTQGHCNLMSPLSLGFFQELLMKNDFLRAYYLGFDWSGWIALIKNRILITKEMSWPVSSDKWKAPLVLTGESGNRHSKKKDEIYKYTRNSV